ncbi:UDP-2,3-diacylglucosamine diphosphatase [Niabella insulamsoli]|uniref:UDP-2,3-diacylglucosamine diphosphatase n=1 Tax=Niabella insulamsoli TaxID=3144874 RepID=UPI0031FC72C2
MNKRPVEVVVASDLHLGTYASKAKEFATYLKSVDPRLLILNGDIIDGWQFSKRYFPPAHIAAIKEIFSKLSGGTRVVYITGNHDDAFRKYSDLELGNFLLADKIAIEVNGKRTWIFHGDVFDHTTYKQAKFLGKLGSNGYAILMGFNKAVNFVLKFFGKEKLSLSKVIMQQFNRRFIKIDEYEQKIAGIAIEKRFDTVICGHIHQPKKRVITNENGSVCYLNSGDWVEHMTALEYYDGDWHLYTYDEKEIVTEKPVREVPKTEVLTSEIALYLHSLAK